MFHLVGALPSQPQNFGHVIVAKWDVFPAKVVYSWLSCKVIIIICAIFSGELYWEVWLADLVIPAKCKLVTHVSRAEVKLEKARRIKWEEFEVSS